MSLAAVFTALVALAAQADPAPPGTSATPSDAVESAIADAEVTGSEASAQPEAASTEVAGITDSVEKGFRACIQQVGNRKFLSTANEVGLAAGGVALSDAASPDVRAVAAQLFTEGPVFGEVVGAPKPVWVVGSATVPACKVTLANTSQAGAARAEFDRRLREAGKWTADQAQSWTRNGVTRQAYVQPAAASGARLLVFVDGPTEPANGGEGIQAIVTVGIMKAEAQ